MRREKRVRNFIVSSLASSLLVLSIDPAACFSNILPKTFLHPLASSQDGLTGPLFAKQFPEDANGAAGDSDRNAAISSKERRNGESEEHKKRKNVDFPSFAYDVKNKYPKSFNEQLLLHFRGDGDDSDRVYATRVVKVPQSPKKKRSPLWTRLVAAFGNTFGYSDLEQLMPTASQTRLLRERAYARSEPFATENITVPPSLDDLSARSREPFEGFWISNQARLLSFGISFFTFPYLTRFLDSFVTMEPGQLDEITSKFVPGISILYGTFISLTLSILYNRQRDIQDNVAMECSLLVIITRVMLSMFKNRQDMAIEAGQCAADQVRTLVRSSRGAELMSIMYSDPYARMLDLLEKHEDELYRNGESDRHTTRIVYSRDVLKELNTLRANRLSDEALALPPTHFLILNILTLLILLGYTISILPTVPIQTGVPSNETSFLFAVLTTIYVLFYNFAYDLNNPFRGVYQVRRSCAASHLLEAKWLIANHPLLQGKLDFDEVEEGQDPGSGVIIRTPGLGDFWFEREKFYVDSNRPDHHQCDLDAEGS